MRTCSGCAAIHTSGKCEFKSTSSDERAISRARTYAWRVIYVSEQTKARNNLCWLHMFDAHPVTFAAGQERYEIIERKGAIA
jgi:hypothetical protein